MLGLFLINSMECPGDLAKTTESTALAKVLQVHLRRRSHLPPPPPPPSPPSPPPLSPSYKYAYAQYQGSLGVILASLGLGMYVLGCMSWACMPGVRQSWSHLRQSWRHVRQSWVRYATIGGFRVAECSSGYCWYARPRPTMPSESDNVAALSSQS